MAQLHDLPLELLPLIIQHLLKASHLASVCLVNHAFNDFAVPMLYERLVIYPWYKDAKIKVAKLFKTLAEYPHHAKHVKRLEIRDFPKSLLGTSPSYLALLHDCMIGLQNCTTLKSCTWTRDGSLTSKILNALSTRYVAHRSPQDPRTHSPEASFDLLDTGFATFSLASASVKLNSALTSEKKSHSDSRLDQAMTRAPLTELEINGHSEGNFDPVLLLKFDKLRKISLIMPSDGVLEMLPRWAGVTGATLTSLTLICKFSNHVTDELLEAIAPSLNSLEHLYLAGCPKVTHKGVWAMIQANPAGIKGLGLEGLSTTFDMAMFAQNAHKGTESCSGLISLTSLTLTIHPSTITPAFTEGVLALLASSPLLHFQIYASSSTRGPTSMVTTASYIATPSHSSASSQAQSTKQRQEDEDKARRQALVDDFCRRVVANHGATLKRFSFHRIRLSLSVVEEVCRKCAGLEQLFMLIMPEELPYLGQILAHAKDMKTVHINFTHRPATYNPREGTQMLVEQCSSSITQFGIETRVWHVEREVVKDENGVAVATKPVLAMYTSPDIPEQFLVVRA
ncbi:uncharacterized protein STEHIDRAFT_168052 [Stereum hirsutum FP-91666 SS1]|uniref:uncharacterized protein n=1 Tax=Stereum hirsutum (strain FP-91666) TaxID=721885 RepID=UPI000440AA4D|nr:uncharacterized protein STEHIDRAFT_168052 [Stereum hirsutum FP-91666 SS1]EIM87235.1 hypothetical protein STEHIDRAFT_168052 [Stereum hirsutum FP-91666 SS1]